MRIPCHVYVRRPARGRSAAAALLPVSALLLTWYPQSAALAGPAPHRTAPLPSVASSEVRAAGRPAGASARLSGASARLSGASARLSGASARLSGRSYDRELREAWSLEELGQFAPARAAYQQLVTDFPHRYEAYHRLGVLDDYEGRHQSAQVWYTRAYRLYSDDPWLLNDLGRCLMDQQKWALAATVLERAVALAPEEPRHRRDLAVARARQGHPADANGGGTPAWQVTDASVPTAAPSTPIASPPAGQAFPGFVPLHPRTPDGGL